MRLMFYCLPPCVEEDSKSDDVEEVKPEDHAMCELRFGRVKRFVGDEDGELFWSFLGGNLWSSPHLGYLGLYI